MGGYFFRFDMIAVNNLSKTYTKGIFRKAVSALDDITFSVERGSVFGIVGANGAGKSTLLKILVGLVFADSGTAQINGMQVINSQARCSVGYLPENPCLYDSLTLEDHLFFASRLFSVSEVDALSRMNDLIYRVGLAGEQKRPLRTFSKGMVQRAALAYALFSNPEVLILDEPMSGLDPLGRKMVLDIVQETNIQGTTVLFCSHVLTDVERICDQIAILDKGKLKLTVTPDQLIGEGTKLKRNESPLESLFMKTVTGKDME
jgi:ABC-2 type transport system ATP-binding protein